MLERCPTPPIPTDMTTACCAPTAGAPRPTRPPTCCPGCGPGQDLLDVGCGPGTITCDLARAVAPGRVVGIDAEPDGARPGPCRGRRRPGLPVTLRGGRPVRPALRRRLLRRGPRPPGAPARGRPGGRTGRDAAGVPSGRRGGRPGRRLPDVHLRSGRARPRPGHRRLRRADPGQPGPLGRGPPPAGLGPCRRVRRGGRPAPRCGASPPTRTAPGGEACGPTGSPRRTRSLGGQLQAHGIADRADLEAFGAGWRRWAASPDGWFAVLHGEILATA